MLMKRVACLTAVAALSAVAAISTAHAQVMIVPIPGAQIPVAPPIEFYTDVPQADPGDDSTYWSARKNVIDSQRYEWLVRTNPAFRAARIQRECGSIREPDLFDQCVATFDY